MSGADRNQLGSDLVRLGIISPEQLEKALRIAAKAGAGIEATVIKLGFADKNEVYRLLAEKMGVPYVDLATWFTDPTAVDLVPREIASRYTLFPMFRILNSLSVAMVDPTDPAAINQVSAVSGCEVEGYLAARSDILAAIERYYPAPLSAEPARKTVLTTQQAAPDPTELSASSRASQHSGRKDMADVISLILDTAVQQHATAVHIEPLEDRVRIRLRVGEKLREMPSPPNILKAAITAHLKALAGLSISESRTCQNGYFRCRIQQQEIVFRLSVLPTMWGESITLGVSGASGPVLCLDELGFSPECLAELKDALACRSGLLLLVGPPCSGKTTTLHALARYLDPARRKIVLIEDTSGQVSPFCHQVRIDRRGGLDEAKALSEALRQDSDVILIDELTTPAAARLAIEAGSQGPLTLATLTAADSAAALVRLNQLGVQPSTGSTSLLAVVAQQLLRKICPRCTEEYSPPPSLVRRLGLSSDDGVRLARGKGCPSCAGSGYSGKIAVFELVEMNRAIARALSQGESADAIRRIIKAAGRKSVVDAAIEKLLRGETSLEEVSKLNGAKTFSQFRTKRRCPLRVPAKQRPASGGSTTVKKTGGLAASRVTTPKERESG